MKKEINKEQLLQKYYDGETTLAEEKWLKEHVLYEDESVEKMIFRDLNLLKKQQVQKNTENKNREDKRTKLVVLSGLIAAACALLFVWKPFEDVVKNQSFESEISKEILVSNSVEGTIEDPEIAMEQARKALAFVSEKLNTGTENMNHLKKLNQVKK